MGMADDERTRTVQMPEDYRERSYVRPHAEAFLAGAADPLGLPTLGLDLLARHAPAISPLSPGTTDWLRRYAGEKRQQSAIGAGFGEALTLSQGATFLAALNAARKYGYLMPSGWMGRDQLHMLGAVPPAGAAFAQFRDLFHLNREKQPAQSEYQPGGAY